MHKSITNFFTTLCEQKKTMENQRKTTYRSVDNKRQSDQRRKAQTNSIELFPNQPFH
jgi:hypothetical protein